MGLVRYGSFFIAIFIEVTMKATFDLLLSIVFIVAIATLVFCILARPLFAVFAFVFEDIGDRSLRFCIFE